MRWQMGRRSSNIEDLRTSGGGRGGLIKGGIGTLVLAGIVALMGGNPLPILLNGFQDAAVLSGGSSAPPTAEEQQQAEFVSVVLADTEDTWNSLLPGYVEPKLVLFRGGVQSACGSASAAMGPFYCPLDQKVYIDLSFYDDLAGRMDAPGDFAQAYVIAHEVGHHVQTLMGISERVRAEQRRNPRLANELSVRQELQADCFAGLWAHHAQRTRNVIEPGDIEEALGAASAVGDDTLQRRSQGMVVPDSFTHGSARQRQEWFHRGFSEGTIEACNTFDARI
jgi:uncharacterized protein